MSLRMSPPALDAQAEHPFIFISYSHRDQAQAMNIIRMLLEAGVSLWYDKGIDPGSEWDDQIAGRIDSCGCMISIVSRNYLSSDNCKDELKYARDLRKDILILYIEECALPSGIALRINRRQAIMKHRYEKEEDFRAELLHASVLQKYITLTSRPEKAQPIRLAAVQEKAPVQIVSMDKLQLGYLAADNTSAVGVDRNALRKRLLICSPAHEQRRRFICQMLLNLYQSGVSFLILSSGSAQYRSLLSLVPDLQIFTPGREEVLPFPFNPFISKETRRLPMGQMITRIAHTLQLALALPPKAHTVLISAIRQCVRRFGMANHDDHMLWDEENIRLFSLRDVLYEYKLLVKAKYSGEEAAELLAVCNDQLQEYMSQNSDVLDRVYSTPVASLLEVPTLIETDAMPDTESQALLIRLLLHFIYLLGKQDPPLPNQGLRQVILIDDINALLDSSNEEEDGALLLGRQVALRHLFRELEATGTFGIIAAAESLQLLGQPLLQDMAEKILWEDAAPENAELLLQLQGKGYFPPCEKEQALLLANDSAATAFLPDLLDEHFCAPISDGDAAMRVCYWEGKQKLLRRYQECDQCLYCREGCTPMIRSAADDAVLRRALRKAEEFIQNGNADENSARYAAAHAESFLDQYPFPAAPGIRQHFIGCLRIRLARELMLRKLWHIPLSGESINHITALSLSCENEERGLIPIGLDEEGKQIIRWDLRLLQGNQQSFAIRWTEKDASASHEKELCAILRQISRLIGPVHIASWENSLLRNSSFENIAYRQQAIEQISSMYAQALARAKAYKENPQALDEMEEQTWVIHITKELLNHLPQETPLRHLANFRMPIRMRIIYLLSSDFSAREFDQELPKEQSLSFGFASYADERRLRERMITGSITVNNQPLFCRFIQE